MTIFGVHVGLQHTTTDDLRGAWRTIEDLGFDWISVWDHFYGATGRPDDLKRRFATAERPEPTLEDAFVALIAAHDGEATGQAA